MTDVRSHRDLIVWQKAMALCVQTYRLASRFPRSEEYRLIAQIARSVVSVPANIAEGNARSTRKDYASFISIARGSLMETDTLLMLAVQLGYVSGEEARPTMSLITEISKMLTTLRKRLLAG